MIKSLLSVLCIFLWSFSAYACPSAIATTVQDCNSFVFHLENTPVGNVTWNFGDGTTTTGSIEIAHSYDLNALYVITATYSGPDCPDGIELTTMVIAECASTPVCPTEISSNTGIECGVMNFEIGSFVDGENVTWFPGDESGAVTGGHFFSHTYATPGNYHVCAFYTTPLCPNGVELCTDIVVEACNANLCPTGISAEAIDCDSYIFHVQGIDNASVVWNFNDGTTTTGGINADHTWSGNGVYVVTAEINAPQCPIVPPTNIITMEFTVEVNCSAAIECPTEISSHIGLDCGVMNFEIGSFVEGELVTWFPGDQSGAVEGGHFFSHTYANSGTYQVCAFYTTPHCPDGVELCTEIIVTGCDTICNLTSLAIDSYVLEGGTTSLVYMLSDVVTGSVLLVGDAMYSEGHPFMDTTVCVQDGCYYLTIESSNPITIGQGFNIFFNINGTNLLENPVVIYQDDFSVTLLISVNSDCQAGASCEAAFEPQFTATPGHIEFANNSTYSGTAQFFWDYGNGNYSDSQGGNVQYETNGIYTVCLTITTDNCTSTLCQVIVVDNMITPCEFNLITMAVDGVYFEPVNEIIQFQATANGVSVFEAVWPTEGQFTQTVELCVPDGCYEVQLASELPLQAISFLCTFMNTNAEQLAAIELTTGMTSTSAAVGVNADCTINVNEFESSQVLAYPNPAASQITFRTDAPISNLTIYDITGKLIESTTPNQQQIQVNTEAWSNGIYLAHVVSKNESVVVPIEIAH